MKRFVQTFDEIIQFFCIVRRTVSVSVPVSVPSALTSSHVLLLSICLDVTICQPGLSAVC